jgi:glycosyltransferase involved in cell wall biosynthesis
VSVPSTITVIVATYERPAALDIVLRALSEQLGEPFEVVIADDGSGERTAEIVEQWLARFEMSHVWRPNEGFQKARLLNRAALVARGGYLVFLDGDCVPRRGFVEAVRRASLPGWFVASKRVHLSPRFTERVLADSVPIWRWSSWHWLARAPRELFTSHHRQANRPGVLFPLRDRGRPWKPGSHEFRPPYNGYGYAFGVLREDFEQVNGFDMRFRGWDGEDVDIADRLRQAGVRCGWPGPDASVLHLWHTPGKQPASPPPREPGAIEAPVGLRELSRELAEAP